MNDETLPTIEQDLDLWLSLLADNELNSQQRTELIHYLDRHPKNWRQCAITLLDDRTLRSQLAMSELSKATEGLTHATAGVVSEKSNRAASDWKRPSSRAILWRRRWVGLVAAAGVLAAFWLGHHLAVNHSRTVIELRQSLTSAQTDVQVVSALWEIEANQKSLSSFFPEQPSLVEIESNVDRTVYLTDRPLSESLVRDFVALGYRVEVQPYRSKTELGLLKNYPRPILEIDVYKSYPVSLVSGE